MTKEQHRQEDMRQNGGAAAGAFASKLIVLALLAWLIIAQTRCTSAPLISSEINLNANGNTVPIKP